MEDTCILFGGEPVVSFEFPGRADVGDIVLSVGRARSRVKCPLGRLFMSTPAETEEGLWSLRVELRNHFTGRAMDVLQGGHAAGMCLHWDVEVPGGRRVAFGIGLDEAMDARESADYLARAVSSAADAAAKCVVRAIMRAGQDLPPEVACAWDERLDEMRGRFGRLPRTRVFLPAETTLRIPLRTSVYSCREKDSHGK